MKRFTISGLLFCVLAAVPIACGGGCGGNGGDEWDAELAPDLKNVDPADLKTLADGNNEFALDLYRQVAARNEGNLCLSPYSISSALAMTYAGARGETAEQMAKVLHFQLEQERLHRAFAVTTYQLHARGKDKSYQLNIANALWGQKGFGFLEPFLELTKHYYRSPLRDVDFAGDREGARRTINGWADERTRGKIKELLKAEDLTPQTRLVLTNAIYFKGTWELPFPKANTKDEAFELSPETSVSVPMMSIGYVKYRYSANDEYSLLELPYKGDKLAMVLLLPVKRHGLREVEQALTAAKLQESVSQLATCDCLVTLPRFQFKSDFKLAPILIEMGMPDAFSHKANFSGMCAGGGLHIRDVIHAGSIEVDEEGTEAAAATAVAMQNSRSRQRIVFCADHPFTYFILDRRDATMLFAGRLSDPR